MIYRQGDVLLESVDGQKPEGKRVQAEDGRLILARSEATGHHHSVSARNAMLFQAAIGVMLLVKKATELQHQEHGEIMLPVGSYKVTRQREYTPQEIRNVQD